jgi:hypothetical protein
MHVNLWMVGLWDVINKDANDYCDDRNPLAALLRAMPQEMQASLAVKESAKEVWDAI